jgi:hypothetical protein
MHGSQVAGCSPEITLSRELPAPFSTPGRQRLWRGKQTQIPNGSRKVLTGLPVNQLCELGDLFGEIKRMRIPAKLIPIAHAILN